jgi:hypothetical protein
MLNALLVAKSCGNRILAIQTEACPPGSTSALPRYLQLRLNFRLARHPEPGRSGPPIRLERSVSAKAIMRSLRFCTS